MTLPRSLGFQLLAGGSVYPLRDLGAWGLGIWIDAPDEPEWTQGKTVEGTLLAADARYPVKLVVRHRTGRLCGFRFVERESALVEQIERWLGPARLGNQLGADPEELPEVDGFRRMVFADRKGDVEVIVTFAPESGMLEGCEVRWGDRFVRRFRNAPAVGGRLKPNARLGDGASGERERAPVLTEWLREAACLLVAGPVSLGGTTLWRFLELGEADRWPGAPQRKAA
jgi:hypothetical protein